MPPHLLRPPMMNPYDSIPPAAPPSDPELHKRIDNLIEYAARYGPEFEALIRERVQENPSYSFLFGGEGHNYYGYKLWLSTRPGANFNPSFASSSIPLMPPPHNLMLNLSPLSPPPLGPVSGGPSSMLSGPQSHQPSKPCSRHISELRPHPARSSPTSSFPMLQIPSLATALQHLLCSDPNHRRNHLISSSPVILHKPPPATPPCDPSPLHVAFAGESKQPAGLPKSDHSKRHFLLDPLL